MPVPAQAESNFPLLPPFCFIQALSRLRLRPTPTGEGGSSLCPLSVEMLISPGNSLTGIPRSSVLLPIWTSCGTVELTHRINHHTSLQLYKLGAIVSLIL